MIRPALPQVKSPVPPDPEPDAAVHPGAEASPAWLRIVLLALSVGGVCVAAALWAAGHGTRGAQVLAGDVLVIFVLLLKV